MYCKNCGKEIGNSRYCPYCGAENGTNVPPSTDAGSVGWAFLGFFVPIVGLVLFLLWREEKPKSAKMAGVGALVRVILSVLAVVIVLAIFGVAIGAMVANVGFDAMTNFIFIP